MNEQLVGKASHIATLIIRRMQEKLTDHESAELEAWLQEDGENYLLYEELMDEEKLGRSLDELHSIDYRVAFEQLSRKLMLPPPKPRRTVPHVWWYMAAALLILTAGAMLYYLMDTGQRSAAMPAPLITAQKKQAGAAADSQKAILILADNTTIELDALVNGPIARQGNSLVQKKSNGELTYTYSTGKTDYEDAYNTIKTPTGTTYHVKLEDGTRIWLNAASTLQFPVHFKGNERRVTLAGEAYFEIATAQSKQTGNKKTFVVHADDMDVQALGTAFNVSAYKEDKQTNTTVLEGLVKVTSGHTDQLLPPGKKLVAKGDSISIVETDIKQEIAWKNGQFVFRNTSLQNVMNELARWYNISVEYKKPMPVLHFSGEIQKQPTIEGALEMLELTGGVQFTVEGNVVNVLPASHY